MLTIYFLGYLQTGWRTHAICWCYWGYVVTILMCDLYSDLNSINYQLHQQLYIVVLSFETARGLSLV